jgi:nicotinamide-nucleotide amidase
MITDKGLHQLAAQLGEELKKRNLKLATAESCTGGWVAEAITSVAGSSEWFECGYVAYSNESKQDMLGVSAATLAGFGAVSEQTVQEMVVGALKQSRAQVALAVSGIAGPGGETAGKPVGTVCFSWGLKGGWPVSHTCALPGNRESVRRQAVELALKGALAVLPG